MSDVLSMWTVYEKPLDYPDGFIARRWETHEGDSQPTNDIRVGQTLDEVRDQLPEGLTRLERAPGDDDRIVEVWL